MSRLARDGTAEPVSRDQILRREWEDHILRREWGQGENIHFFCSPDHEQNWQHYPVDPYSAMYAITVHTYIRLGRTLSDCIVIVAG